jgi:hypothetical protein
LATKDLPTVSVTRRGTASDIWSKILLAVISETGQQRKAQGSMIHYSLMDENSSRKGTSRREMRELVLWIFEEATLEVDLAYPLYE